MSAARWILACCSAAALHTACFQDDPARTLQPATAAPVSNQLVDDVRLARWQAWERLAAGLPDGHVLSVEMLHSRPGQAFAVFTVVRDHHAVQGVVTAERRPIRRAAADDEVLPDAFALGEPPPKEKPTPGVVAQGSSLLSAAFPGEVDSAAMRDESAFSDGSRAAPPAIAVSKEMVDQVRIARWHAWDKMATSLPDGYVLAIEMLHSRPGDAFAVFTQVREHRAVQSVVTTARRSVKLAVAASAVGDGEPVAEAITLGSPPEKETPSPGVIALGSSLLETTFDLGEHAVDSTQTQ